MTYRPGLVVAEVEDPQIYPRTLNQDPLARLQLYARLGARLLELRYVQPETNPGAGRVRNLLLLVAQEYSTAVVAEPNGVIKVREDDLLHQRQGPTEPLALNWAKPRSALVSASAIRAPSLRAWAWGASRGLD